MKKALSWARQHVATIVAACMSIVSALLGVILFRQRRGSQPSLPNVEAAAATAHAEGAASVLTAQAQSMEKRAEQLQAEVEQAKVPVPSKPISEMNDEEFRASLFPGAGSN